MTDPMSPVARRLGTTAGQAWTLTLGLLLAAVLLASSLPPVLDARSAPRRAAAAAPAPGGGLSGLPAASPLPAPAPAPAATPEMLPPAPLLPATLALAPAQPAPQPAPQPVAPAPAAPEPAPVDLPQTAGPLSVREAGFFSPDPAALAVSGTPEDGVPISARLGESREQAYVRLAGTGTELRLMLSEESDANLNPSAAAVRACRIRNEDWRAARPGPAVAFDAEDCVPGVRQSDGAFLFGLAGSPDRTGPRGFALVVDPDAPAPAVPRTFRVVLTPVPPSTPESSS